MPRRKKPQETSHQPKNIFNLSNALMKSPLRYTLMERRFLYKLIEAIKQRFTELGLSVRKNWDNLTFTMTNKDLADIGGSNHLTRTYKIIRQLADRSVIQYYYNDKDQFVLDYFHWISAFRWNTVTNDYTVTVSPQFFDYICNLKKLFTHMDLRAGMRMDTKYSQKFFELCCMFTSDKDKPYRFNDAKNSGKPYKSNVRPMTVREFRDIFGLSELHDPRTGEKIEREKFRMFKKMEDKVIIPSRTELFERFKRGECNVWFDYTVERSGRGRGGSPQRINLFFYTHEFPKSSDPLSDCPRKDGETIDPFLDADLARQLFGDARNSKDASKSNKKTFGKKKVDSSNYQPSLFGKDYDDRELRGIIVAMLKRYLSQEEVAYYLKEIDKVQQSNKDSYRQVVDELLAKTRQNKFSKQAEAWKRKNIKDYVLKENLKQYGWSIPPMNEEDK